jgi:hypothetical protein
MPTAAQNEQMIARMRYPGLMRLWDQILAKGTAPAWDPGKALEYLVLRAFQLEGAFVTWPYQISAGKGTIEQIDGVVYVEGIACILECKDHADRMDYDAIAVLRDQINRRPAGTFGSCISTSGFTVTALQLVTYGRQEIAVWTKEDLDYALRRRKMLLGLHAKYRWCVESAMPDLDLKAAKI